MGKVWLGLLNLIDFFVGQLAVIRGPCVFVLKHELNTSSTMLESGNIHSSSTPFSVFRAGGSVCSSCDVIKQLMSQYILQELFPLLLFLQIVPYDSLNFTFLFFQHFSFSALFLSSLSDHWEKEAMLLSNQYETSQYCVQY